MQNSVLTKLQNLSIAKSLPHSWLFTGSVNSEKLSVAQDFCKWLLCTSESKQAIACGECKSCNLFVAQVHPDFCLITPQPDKTSILMEDVRVLPDFIVGQPQFSANKVVLLYPAESMHKQAANSLLKNLEEPSGETIFFLIAQHADLLLKTIVSRCQVLNFNAAAITSDNTAAAQMVADLKDLWLSKSTTSVQVVEKWLKQWPNETLYWFDVVLMDLIRFKYTQDVTLLKYADSQQSALDSVMPEHKLWQLLDKLRQAQNWLGNSHKPNMQLLLEDMLLP